MEYQLLTRHAHRDAKRGHLYVGDIVRVEEPREAADLLALRGGANYGASAFGQVIVGQGFSYFEPVNFTLKQLKEALEGDKPEAKPEVDAEAEAKAKAEAEAKAKAEAEAAEAAAKAEAEAKAAAEAPAEAPAEVPAEAPAETPAEAPAEAEAEAPAKPSKKK